MKSWENLDLYPDDAGRSQDATVAYGRGLPRSSKAYRVVDCFLFTAIVESLRSDDRAAGHPPASAFGSAPQGM